jgi:hypothetical protein
MHDFDLHEWFADEELATCPRCGEHAAIKIPTGAFVCLACGFIRPASDEAIENTPDSTNAAAGDL